MDVSDLAVAPLEPHYVARLRIGAVFEDRGHLPTLEPMSSPSMADPMRRAPQANTQTSLMAPPDAHPHHHLAFACAGRVVNFGPHDNGAVPDI